MSLLLELVVIYSMLLSGCLFEIGIKMAESNGTMIEGMDGVDESAKDDSEIFVCIKTPQDIQKVSVYRTNTVKQVCCAIVARFR